jgi:hypothetical protein
LNLLCLNYVSIEVVVELATSFYITNIHHLLELEFSIT